MGWLGFGVVLGGLAAWEAARAAAARATVTEGWGAGLAAGAGGGLALFALLAVTVLVQLRRQRAWRGGRPLLILAVTIALLLFVAVPTTMQLRPIGPNRAPYVVTSGVGVAEIAYVSTCLALLAVLPAVAIPMAEARRRRRSHQRGLS
jgi:predicted lipid-binding transport protein (Tim44 family)